MIILVDYDNIPTALQRKGLRYLLDYLIEIMTDTMVCDERRISLRLYGGWYEQQSYTRKAQDLAAEIDAEFPCVTAKIVDSIKREFYGTAELAYSLLATPDKHLFMTYRCRPYSSGVRCKHPKDANCNDPACSMMPVYKFFSEGQCNKDGCGKKIKEYLYKSEQKLVDSMLTCDLVYLSKEDEKIVVLSSDDDFWPPILMALELGRFVIHIQTTPLQRDNYKYLLSSRCKYFSLNLERRFT